MPDLDYAKVIGRFGDTVSDGVDVDDNPDTIWCDEGTIEITPLITFTKVVGGTPVPWTAGHSVITAQISSADPESPNYYVGGAGYLLYNGDPFVYVVDLTSNKVNPQIGANKATHRVTFKNVKAAGTPVNFVSTTVRLTADGPDLDGINDLTKLMPVDPGASVAMFRGERGEQGLPGNDSAAWLPADAVTTGTVRQAPDGSWIKSNSTRTTRPSFDATEKTYWDAVSVLAGTFEADALARKFIQYLPVSNGADDTTMWQAALDAGGYIKAKAGETYLVDDLIATTPGWVDLQGATVKHRDGAADSAGTHAPFAIQTSSFAITGGTIDANRGGQDKTAFNTAGGAGGGHFLFGIAVEGTEGTPYTNIIIDTEIINSADAGISASFVSQSRFTFGVTDSGAGAQFNDCELSTIDAQFQSLDNSGWKIFPHVIDLNRCTSLDVTINSRDHSGNGTVAGGTALSNWLSGLTAIDCDDITIHGLRLHFRHDNTMSRGLAVSLLSCRGFTVYGTSIESPSDCAIELGGVIDTHFIGGHIDGRYTTGPSAYAGRGVSFYNIGFVRDISHRVTRYTDNVSFTDFVIERMMGDALVFEAARNVRFFNTHVRSSQRGALSKYAANDATDAVTQTPHLITGLDFFGGSFEAHEQSGFDAYDLTHAKFYGTRFLRNGQCNSGGGSDSTHTRNGQLVDTSAAGFKTRTSTSPLGNKVGVEFHGCRFDDTQYDQANSAVYTTYGSINPSDPTVVSLVLGDANIIAGLTIKLAGAGVAAADLTTMVDADSLDEITLHVGAATQPTVSGTGTISSAGTTITGSGTNFDPEFNARYWITAAGQTRRVIKVADDTHATTDTAFSPALPAGTSFTIHKVTITTIPSQQWAALLSADTISARFYGGTNPFGNVQGVVSDANSANTDRASLIGVPNQASYFKNSLYSGGTVRAQRDLATEVAIGGVGPGGASGLTADNGGLNLYKDGTDRWKTDDALVVDKTIRVGQYTTAGRPTASTAGAGGMYYDTTLNKPGYSDGTNWRDAAGTII